MSDEKPPGYYEQSDLWDLERYEGNARQNLRARLTAALVDPEARSVLDVGCGNGFVTRRIRAPRVVGLDPSQEALSGFEGESVRGVADAIPFQDREFDAVVCCEVLEHLDEETFLKATKELSRVCSEWLVIGVPYRERLSEEKIRCEHCRRTYHANLHQRSFRSAEEVSSLFPRFSVAASMLLGYRQRVRSRLYRRLRGLLLGRTRGLSLAVCPSCGRSPSGESGRVRGLLKRIFAGLGWRMPKRPEARWILVLLQATEDAARETPAQASE